jgi:hypothetical protein
MMYAVEMGSGAMIYIPSFIKIGPGIQNLVEENTQSHRQEEDRISLLCTILVKLLRSFTFVMQIIRWVYRLKR